MSTNTAKHERVQHERVSILSLADNKTGQNTKSVLPQHICDICETRTTFFFFKGHIIAGFHNTKPVSICDKCEAPTTFYPSKGI